MGLVDSYKRMLQKLLPPGEAWNREENSVLTKILGAIADELALVHNRALDLIEESDPQTTTELIEEWENFVGLPDSCVGPAGTLQERREQVHAKLIAKRGQSKADYIDLAETLGFIVTITEPFPFRSGSSSSGDPIYNQNWRHWWIVDVPYTESQFFESGNSSSGDPIAWYDNKIITCTFSKRKQSQTKILFRFPSEAS